MVEAGWEMLPGGWLSSDIFDPLGNRKAKIQVLPDPRANALKPTLAAWWRSRFAWMWEKRVVKHHHFAKSKVTCEPTGQTSLLSSIAQSAVKNAMRQSPKLPPIVPARGQCSSGPTRRWSLQWCWSSDFGHWDPPDHLFWSHTPPNILGEGGCWGHHSDVPAATTALPGQIHTDTSEANTARPLGGSPPPCSGPEGVGWLFNTYYWGRSYEVICERFSLASYTTD